MSESKEFKCIHNPHCKGPDHRPLEICGRCLGELTTRLLHVELAKSEPKVKGRKHARLVK
jgi:hypothetical protein